MRMPRICPATFSASAGVLASLMPPALPRLPAGTCAFTTQGPIFAAAIAASAALMHKMPRGTGMPAGARISDFAACSSKFMICFLLVAAMRTVEGRLPLPERCAELRPYFFQYAPNNSSSLGLSSGMVVTRWVMLRKCL